VRRLATNPPVRIPLRDMRSACFGCNEDVFGKIEEVGR